MKPVVKITESYDRVTVSVKLGGTMARLTISRGGERLSATNKLLADWIWAAWKETKGSYGDRAKKLKAILEE